MWINKRLSFPFPHLVLCKILLTLYVYIVVQNNVCSYISIYSADHKRYGNSTSRYRFYEAFCYPSCLDSLKNMIISQDLSQLLTLWQTFNVFIMTGTWIGYVVIIFVAVWSGVIVFDSDHYFWVPLIVIDDHWLNVSVVIVLAFSFIYFSSFCSVLF